MDLVKALRLGSLPRVAFVGAGGKTTAMFTLARELRPPVWVTATTHLAVEQFSLADAHFFVESPQDVEAVLEQARTPNVVLFVGPEVEAGRTSGLRAESLTRLHTLADSLEVPLLIEADGSRQKPLKAPAPYEPVISDFVDTVVVVAGLSALNQPLTADRVHRLERFSPLSGLQVGEAITPQALAQVLTHPQGGLKGIPGKARHVALLNQADTAVLREQASSLAGYLLPSYQAVVVSALKPSDGPPEAEDLPGVYAVHERIAGVILAAGEARRFGQSKLTLPWRGKPLVSHVAQTALEAELAPVIVVTGAHREQVSEALVGLPLNLVHNPQWEKGQSTSLQAGLGEVPADVGGVVFLLADQPGVPVGLIQELVAVHSRGLSPIVAPRVRGKRGNPVLFDRALFPELMMVSGDVGGRSLFGQYQAEWVPWEDAGMLIDVDVEEDYQRLLGMDEQVKDVKDQ
ncbi:MAG: selenium cofactor biosynthesis protein YqeC [Chloroflexota bacterium]